MAQPLLDFLTGRAKAALPFFRRGVTMGLGSNDILVQVGERFGGIRRQTGLDIIAVLRGQIAPERSFRLTGETIPLPNELHAPAPFHISQNYTYIVEFPENALGVQTLLSVTSAVPLAAEEIRTRGADLASEGGESNIELGVINPDAVTIKEAWRSVETTLP